mgnify:CR=1 FL=1
MGHITLTLIKPDAMKAGHAGKIIDRMIQDGFTIKAMRLLQMQTQDAESFYEVHRERPFFNDLVQYMCSGPIIAMVLEKDHAVEAFRTFIGATNPQDAAEGTIRKDFGTSIEANAVHGSDSDENAQREAHFFFSDLQMV